MVNYLIYPAEIGTPNGPCSATCSHISCILKRKDANKVCIACGEPMPYGTRVIFSAYEQPGHYECAAKRIESLRDQKASELVGLIGLPPSGDEDLDQRQGARILVLTAAVEVMERWLVEAATNDELIQALDAVFTPGTGASYVHPGYLRVNNISSIERIEGNRRHDGVKRAGGKKVLNAADYGVQSNQEPEQPAS